MRKRKINKNISTIVAILLTILVLSPFYIVIVNSAKTSNEIVMDPIALPNAWSQIFVNMKNVIYNQNFSYWNSLFSSVFITVVSVILVSLTSAMAAWVLARNKTKWSNVIFMVFVAGMVIPFQVVMLPMISNFRIMSEFTGIKMLSSYKGIIFSYIGFGGSMTIFILHGFIKGIPYELEESAYIDGASPERTFFNIVFPLLKPPVTTTIILNSMWIWNDYQLPSLMLGLNGRIKTLPIAVNAFVGSYVKQWDLILTAALLAMIPIIILFIFAQKQIMQGMIDGAVKG